jgi:sulfur-carrier protein adenylyltransferase/sulfurtransferase
MMVKGIAPLELKTRLDDGEDIMVIDVREDWELEMSKLEGVVHIPMSDIPDSVSQLPKDKPVVIICRTGSRSTNVVKWLETQGFSNMLNLDGGINRWADDVDETLMQY